MGKQKFKAGQGQQRKKEKEWEYVPIDANCFTDDKEFENLISFEVLTDYHVTKGSVTNEDEGDDSDDFGDELEEGWKSSKAKKSKKRKRAVVENESESESEEEELDEVIVVEEAKPQKKEKNVRKEAESKTNLNEKVKNSQKEAKVSKAKKEINSVEQEPSTSSKINSKDAKISKKVNAKKQKMEQEDENLEDVEHSVDTVNMEAWSKLGVPEIVLKALSENGFDTPTPIQNLTLPAAILGKKDIVGAAETGSGKTLAFAIPIINGILNERSERERKELEAADPEESDEVDDEIDPDGLRALILTPTRELAVQIKNHIDAVSRYANIRVVVIVGGLAAQKQERLLRSKPEIVIATPGRLWELAQSGNPHLSTLNRIRYLTIDETDRMVEQGHFHELKGILGVLNSDPENQTRRQNFVFSATLAFTHEPPQRLNKRSPKMKKNKKQTKKVSPEDKLHSIMEMIGVKENAKVVDITSGKGTCETLVEMSISCQLSQKDYYLYYFFICHPGRTIIFCNSINCVRRLVNLFFLLQCEPLALHSEMAQKQRLRSLERFAANDKGILIATDVAARGLDITNIQHVIHYQVPRTAESYIHRSGRTARAFKGGLALVLVEPAETSAFWNISRSLGRDEPLPSFRVDGEVFREIKARVDLGIKVEKFEHQVRKKFADISWAEKAKKDMDLASSDEDSDRDIGGRRETKKNMQSAKKELESSKFELAELISANSLLFRKSLDISAALKKQMTASTKPAVPSST